MSEPVILMLAIPAACHNNEPLPRNLGIRSRGIRALTICKVRVKDRGFQISLLTAYLPVQKSPALLRRHARLVGQVVMDNLGCPDVSCTY